MLDKIFTSAIKYSTKVKTFIGLLSLIATTSAISLFFIYQSIDEYRYIIIIGLILIILSAMMIALIHATKKENNIKENFEYDVYISYPVSNISENEYIEITNLIKQIINILESKNLSVYGTIKSKNNKTIPMNDTKALLKSQNFILIYPEKTISSVIFEAGIAYAYNKESHYFIKNINNLPVAMKEANKYSDNIFIHEFTTYDIILNFIENFNNLKKDG